MLKIALNDCLFWNSCNTQKKPIQKLIFASSIEKCLFFLMVSKLSTEMNANIEKKTSEEVSQNLSRVSLASLASREYECMTRRERTTRQKRSEKNSLASPLTRWAFILTRGERSEFFTRESLWCIHTHAKKRYVRSLRSLRVSMNPALYRYDRPWWLWMRSSIFVASA